MIDLEAERPLSVAQAAKLIPSSRKGKPVHASTVVRWILHGVRGVRLEAARLGGGWVTSREALDRFSAALTAQSMPAADATSRPGPVTSKARDKHNEEVAAELVALGV